MAPNSVYDPDADERRIQRAPSDDELRNVTGINPEQEGAMDREAQRGAQQDLRSAEQGGLYNADGEKEKSVRPTALKGAEAAAALSIGGPAKKAIGALSKVTSVINNNKKKTAVGGGLVAGLTGLLIVGFMSLLPLKIMHVTSNLQNQFFAASEEATENIGDKLFRQYIVTKVIPGMVKGNCTSTRASKSCASVGEATNPVSALYVAWSNARLEGRLYDNYGIEIIRDGKNFYFRSDSLRERVFLGEYNENNTRVFENKVFSELNRSEIRREVRTALEAETLRKRLMYRYSVGNLLERKYGIKRCIVACQTRDKRSDKIEARRTAFKSYLAERVLTPRSEAMGLALECALNSFNCADPGEANQDGERRSQYERDLSARLQDYRSRYGTSSLTELQAEADRIGERGFGNYVIRRIAGETAGKAITKAIPVVGWVDLGARIVDSGRNAGPAIRKINYVMNSTAMVSMYAMYATSADEIKAGETDLTSLGSISDSLSPNIDNDQGGAGAEASPLYGAIMGDTSDNQASLLSSVLPSAYAANGTTSYKCDDGGSVPEGKLVCPEVSFDAQSSVGKIADTISEISNSRGADFFIGTAASAYLNTVGKLFDFAGSLLSAALGPLIPSQLEDITEWIQNKIFSKILVNPVSEKSSGARQFELAAGGADIAANEYAHYGQGAPIATAQEIGQIRSARMAREQGNFESLPLYSRLFDTSYANSLSSQFALSLPSTYHKAPSTIASGLLDPAKMLANGLSTVTAPKKVGAAMSFSEDPFGIDQYAWPTSHPVFTDEVNLEQYWDQNSCSDTNQIKEWGDKGIIDPETLIVKHTVANPCLLLRSSVANSGGKYDTSLLENPVSDSGATSTLPSPNLTDVNDVFGPSDTIQCPNGIPDGGVQQGYNKGQLVPIRVCIITGVGINVKIAQNVATLIQDASKQGIDLKAGSGYRTMSQQTSLYRRNCPKGENGRCTPPTARPGYSNHQMGLAIDFKYNNETICFLPKSRNKTVNCKGNAGLEWLKVNAARYGLKNLPDEAWHWSVDGS